MSHLRQRKPSPPANVGVVGKPATPLKTMIGENEPKLLPYNDLPEWYQDNAFILHGYRPVTNSSRASFASLLYLHNETINIYSHLLPAILFLAAEGGMYQYLHVRYPNATALDHVVFAFFLLTAVVCLGFSATYHTLLNHSAHIANVWLRLDLVGIVVLTLGDFVSGILMVFYCEPLYQRIYWAMACVTFASCR